MSRSSAHRRRPTAVIVAFGLLVPALVGTTLASAPAAQAKPHHHRKAPILSPRAGHKQPAKPLRIRVRAGRHASVWARLNGRRIPSRLFKPAPRHGVRKAKVSPNLGLKHGRNHLRVRVHRRHARRAHFQKMRFRVARNRPLAAVGLDGRTIAGTPTYISAAESRPRPGSRPATSAPNQGLSFDWDIKQAPPEASLPLAPLDDPTWVPTFTDPGKYVVSLVVNEPDGTASAPDTRTINVKPPPMVSVDSQLLGKDGPNDWGIQVGTSEYFAKTAPNPWLQVLVLDRNTLEALVNKTFSCPTSASTQSCIDQVKQAFSGDNALDDNELVVAANHPGYESPEGAPDALQSIGVGVANRTWPWYVDPSTGNASGGYSAIGVPGDPAGTAAEAWKRNPPTSPCDASCADVRGYLVQDYTDNLNYNWMSAERVPFDTHAQGSSDTQNVIQIGKQTYSQQLGAGQTGGFQVVVADRYDLSQVQKAWFPTAGSGVDESTYQGSLNGMAAMLRDAASTPVTSPLLGGDGKQLCVDLRGGSSAPGTVAQIFTCNGTDAQQFVAIPGISPTRDGRAGVELQAKGKCLQVSGTNDQAPVTIDNCNNQEWQMWHFDDQGRIVGYGGRCLAIGGAAADHNKPGTALVVANCNSYLSQQWHTDSSKMAFVASVGSPQVRLTAGSPSEKTTYDRGVAIAGVGDAVAALGGTSSAFTGLPAGTAPQLYGLVGWAGAVPARAPQVHGPTDQLPTARIAGTLSTDKWQRYEVQDNDAGATRAQPTSAAATHAGLATQADDTQPMDIVWGTPTTVWPDQDPKKFPDPLQRQRLQAAIAWISNQPGIYRGGDIRAAYFNRKWDPGSDPTAWQKTEDAIKSIHYSDCKATKGCEQQFTEDDFKWAQTELVQEIDDLIAEHEYLAKLLKPQSDAGKVFDFQNKVDAAAKQLQDDKVVPPPTSQDKTGIWARFIVNTAIEAVGVIPGIGPFAKEGFEIARSVIDGGGAIMNGILDGMEIANEKETGDPGPPSDELGGAVIAVKDQIAKQYNAAQNSTDMFARVVASDPAKLDEMAKLWLGCRNNDNCPADWRLSPHDQSIMESMLSYSTQRTAWSMLVPAAYGAWQIRIWAYGPNVQHTGHVGHNFDTSVTGFADATKLQCYYNPPFGSSQHLRPFQSEGPNGMAAFRQGYGYEGDGLWEGPNDSLDYGSNGLTYKLWALGEQDSSDKDKYTVPGSGVFDRLFAPMDKSLNPDKGGLGVDKLDWYAQTFTPRLYTPQDPKWYKDGHPNCDFDGG